jgi:multicomponent Na+:H+ antiporter subunit B
MISSELALPEEKRMQAVSIVTPNYIHYDHARKLIENGFHVICDKPVTTTAKDAIHLDELVKKHKVVFCLTHTYTGYPMVRQMRKMIEAGAIGEFQRIDNLWVPYDLIITTTCRLVIPFIQLFALYVIAHGHHSPGGGFQGGVILGASIILYAISHDLRSAMKRMSEKIGALFSTAGILIYAGTGALCLVLGANFLDYSALAGLLGVDPITARSHGILIVEIGVGLAVMATMIWIYYVLSSVGRNDEGL